MKRSHKKRHEDPVTQIPYGTRTYEAISEALSYDEETGALIWKVRPRNHFKTLRAQSTWNARYAGLRADLTFHKGYRTITVFRTAYKAHRVVFLLKTGAWPSMIMDHINGDRQDNRWVNLRLATPVENSCNSKTPKNSTSGIKGVHRENGKWTARLRVNGVTVYRKRGFATKQEAFLALVPVRIKEHGDFANHGDFISNTYSYNLTP